ncbi:oxidoreductase [Anoxybacillus sp. J5B_2022]|uniref:oxidoreductase n=1 Tax=Anoxybacillus sp. J5B_2022 TaxID=3003246 RepID=UPI002285B665|nr:oxidoreductase [Anoxybacillus sp. J5B_2022]MCZ0755488.1 oxidoreductase [Anoxybacillus sp. J5B_2022]
MEDRTALLIGASGLIGRELLTLLLQSDVYEQVTVLVRRRLPMEHEKLQQVVIDFNKLESYERYFYVDDVFSCLGTTMKKAKTKQRFIQVDYEYTMRAATLAEKCHVQSFLTVSAIGADPHSPFFYNRVKGETEEALQRLSIPSLHIFRPSLLIGKREEFRLVEKTAEWVFGRLPFLFVGKWRKYKPIEAKQVALAMFHAATACRKGIYIYESDEVAAFV